MESRSKNLEWNPGVEGGVEAWSGSSEWRLGTRRLGTDAWNAGVEWRLGVEARIERFGGKANRQLTHNENPIYYPPRDGCT